MMKHGKKRGMQNRWERNKGEKEELWCKKRRRRVIK